MITFQTIEEKDQQFVSKVYRRTREKELPFAYLPEEQKSGLLLMQLEAQLADYERNYIGAKRQIILYNEERVGYIYTWDSKREIRILDISLLPEFQGNGIGGTILNDILKTGKQQHKKVSLHVALGNPAKRLYERLGFVKISDNFTHEYMEYKAS